MLTKLTYDLLWCHYDYKVAVLIHKRSNSFIKIYFCFCLQFTAFKFFMILRNKQICCAGMGVTKIVENILLLRSKQNCQHAFFKMFEFWAGPSGFQDVCYEIKKLYNNYFLFFKLFYCLNAYSGLRIWCNYRWYCPLKLHGNHAFRRTYFQCWI